MFCKIKVTSPATVAYEILMPLKVTNRYLTQTATSFPPFAILFTGVFVIQINPISLELANIYFHESENNEGGGSAVIILQYYMKRWRAET